jgi:hypothetical protein
VLRYDGYSGGTTLSLNKRECRRQRRGRQIRAESQFGPTMRRSAADGPSPADTRCSQAWPAVSTHGAVTMVGVRLSTEGPVCGLGGETRPATRLAVPHGVLLKMS